MIQKALTTLFIAAFFCLSCFAQLNHTLSSGISYSDTLDNPRDFPSSNWDKFYSNSSFERFICVKGVSESTVIAQIEEFSELFGKGKKEYVYGIFSKNDWVYVKIPNQHDAWTFHNIVYWFLDYSSSDPDGAEESIGIFMSDDQSYCIYNDYKLRDQYGVIDVLFLASSNGTRELVSIPFDVVVTDEEALIPSYQDLLSKFKLTEKEIQGLEYKSKSFYFPE